MKKNLIIHVPHASLYFPNLFFNNLLIPKDEIQKENIFISDYLVDKLLPEYIENVFIFKCSRLFCDVERFLDDEKESMSKLGMGAIYEKDSNGKKFIKINEKYKKEVISNYYLPFHKLLDDKTIELVNEYGECYFIDLHSFSDEFVEKVLEKKDNPDICIGIDEKYSDKKIIEYTIKFFEDNGYTTKINYPYSGTLIPNVALINEKYKVKSIMIEINKRIYLDNNEIVNEQKFNKLKKCIEE